MRQFAEAVQLDPIYDIAKVLPLTLFRGNEGAFVEHGEYGSV
jgi:hypothetical protein